MVGIAPAGHRVPRFEHIVGAERIARVQPQFTGATRAGAKQRLGACRSPRQHGLELGAGDDGRDLLGVRPGIDQLLLQRRSIRAGPGVQFEH